MAQANVADFQNKELKSNLIRTPFSLNKIKTNNSIFFIILEYPLKRIIFKKL